MQQSHAGQTPPAQQFFTFLAIFDIKTPFYIYFTWKTLWFEKLILLEKGLKRFIIVYKGLFGLFSKKSSQALFDCKSGKCLP